MTTVILVGLFLCGLGPGDTRALELGVPFRGRLGAGDPPLEGHGPSRTFEFSPPSTRHIAIDLSSFDFDVFLRVESGDGRRLAENDDGGLETNARIELAVQEERRYRIVVAARNPRRKGVPGPDGEFQVVVSSTSGAAGPRVTLEQAIAFRQEAARRALSRGRERQGMRHLALAGKQLSSASRYSEATVCLNRTLALARKLEDPGMELEVLKSLGYVDLGQSQVPRALKRFASRRTLAAQVGNVEAELDALRDLSRAHLFREEIDEAHELRAQQLVLTRRHGRRPDEGACLLALAGLEVRLDDRSQARRSYSEAILIFRDLEDGHGEIRAREGISRLFLDAGDRAEARKHLTRALELAREMEVESIETRVRSLLRQLDGPGDEGRR